MKSCWGRTSGFVGAEVQHCPEEMRYEVLIVHAVCGKYKVHWLEVLQLVWLQPVQLSYAGCASICCPWDSIACDTCVSARWLLLAHDHAIHAIEQGP